MEKTYKTSEAAGIAGIHPNTVRMYEDLGLIPKANRRENGYRIYSGEDIRRLKIIRSLKCANYSLASILRMMNALTENENADISQLLNTPDKNEDIISVCDKLLLSLNEARANAKQMIVMLTATIHRTPCERYTVFNET